MGGSRHKLRSQIICERTLDDENDGTSARTRPLSYDEIMFKRKSKKELVGFSEEVREEETTRHEEPIRNPNRLSRDPNIYRQRRDTNVDPKRRDAIVGHQGRDTNGDHQRRDANVGRQSRDTNGDHQRKDANIGRQSRDTNGDHQRRDENVGRQSRDTNVDHQRRDANVGHQNRDTNGDHQRRDANIGRQSRDTNDDHQRRDANVGRQSRDTNGDHQRKDANVGRQSRDTHGDHQRRDANVDHQRRDSKVGRQSRDTHGDHQRRDANVGRQSRDTNDASSKNLREYPRENSPKKRVDKSFRMEHTHHKSGNIERRDMESRSVQKHGNDVRNTTEYDSHKEGRKGKADEDPRGDSRYNHENKHRRDSVIQDRYKDKNIGASEREIKRKDRSEDDEKYRIRDPVKKHDSGSRRDSEISEKKEKTDFSRSHHDETRSKRRRSRSPERVKDKSRRSKSTSPKARKNMSYHAHDHNEPSSRSEKERSRRHPDVDRTKMSGDGPSNNQRRHGGSSSGLGGYSPRKRKSEAAVKTPSPIHSPERKSAGWEHPPPGPDKDLSTIVPSGTPLVSQAKPSNVVDLAAGFSVASTMGKPISAILSNNLSAFKQASIDSVQLTQATRPMRRLYIENIPVSVTEKDIMECFNTFLLYSVPNHIRGTPPCISCMIHKEKGQALVEFLTPEDASAALSLDGRSLCGSILKIRRPKDYVEVQQVPSENSEKSEAGGDLTSEVAITDFVKDSPHKIFVGGIAEGLSSEMIMEIVSAFGTLKAYHFEVNEDVREPCAFLEFADPSVTLKACAGLNGMKLGGRVLTVVQAFPDSDIAESSRSQPFYGIPDHVKPLLQMPTEVLKLSNVLDQKAVDALSETDLEEVLEDVRLECSRFGSVVSINVGRSSDTYVPNPESNEIPHDIDTVQLPENKSNYFNTNPIEGSMHLKDGDVINGELLTDTKEFNEGKSVGGHNDELDTTTRNPNVELPPSEGSPVEESKETAIERPSDSDETHHPTSLNEIGVSSELNSNESRGSKSKDVETLHDQDVLGLEENNGTVSKNPSALNKGLETENFFEVGSILVEFKRVEASCMAAHCLHGRVFDDRVVSVEYVPLKAYREVFSK